MSKSNSILEIINQRRLNKISSTQCNGISLIKKEGDSETYYPATTNKAWELAESFLTSQEFQSERISLLTMAKKYKDSPNADFLRFFNDNGTLLIENVPSLGTEITCEDEGTPSSVAQVAYFVKDFKTGEIYFPKTSTDAWTLVKKLLPRNLVRKAANYSIDQEISGSLEFNTQKPSEN